MGRNPIRPFTRHWAVPKTIWGLIAVEFAFVVATLTLFGIANPDLYRTKLWKEGSSHGWNSDPSDKTYALANYQHYESPLVWSQLYVASIPLSIFFARRAFLLLPPRFDHHHYHHPPSTTTVPAPAPAAGPQVAAVEQPLSPSLPTTTTQLRPLVAACRVMQK